MSWKRRIAGLTPDFSVGRLFAHGAELIGEVVQYGNSYRLCYLRGPEGIMIALAEQIG